MRVSNCGYDFRHDMNYTAERPAGTEGHILMVIRSPARIVLRGQVHYTKGNCVVLYHMDSPQFYYALNTEFVNDWVRFNINDEELAFLESIGIYFDSIMEYADVYPLSRYIKIMAVERGSSNHNAKESTALLLRLLLLKLSDYIANKPVIHSNLTEKLTIIRNNIYSNPQNDWSIDTICKTTSLSPSYLQHKYKQIFGSSIKNDIIESRLQYCKQLLATTNYTVAMISRMGGYANEISFMCIFKKKTGFTPSQYRRSSTTYGK